MYNKNIPFRDIHICFFQGEKGMKNGTKTKAAVAVERTKMTVGKIIGIVLVVLMAMAIFGSFIPTKDESGNTKPYDVSTLIFMLILAGLGVFLIIRSGKRKQLISNFEEYVRIIANDPENSLNTIATKTNQPLGEVRKNVATMIKKKFFANAELDDANDRIILNHNTVYDVLNNKQQQARDTEIENSKPVEMVTVSCPGCGARVPIPRGKSAPCEYCGTYLQG